LIGGEAGSGKSRLVRELAHEGATSDALVLYGACDAVVRTPYRPFAEALEQLVRAADAGELRADLGTTGGELARLVPDLAVRVGELPPPVTADPDTERHRLHTAVADLLTATSRRRPLLVIVEDSHWADQPTLLLLRHLGRAATDARMLLLATFRDTEADVPDELSDALVDLRRSEDVVRLHLGGLSGEEIAEFVQRATGTDLGSGVSELATAIHELTGGNAFLMTELWRALFETGALLVEGDRVRLERPLSQLGTSEGVREVVSQRLARLATPTTDLLEVASVIGRVFELGVLERASLLTRHELLSGLDEALRSGMIEEISPIGLLYRFTHELVRRAVSDRLTGIRRAEIHLRVGEAIERSSGGDVGRVLPDLAYHFTAAVPVGGADRAIEYNVRAARAARTGLAFDAAATLLRTALELTVENPARAELQLELGAANHVAGRADEALESYAAAAAVARELGDAELLARAAIGFENACWRPSITDRGADELLEEAAVALGDGDSILRVRVLSGLSRALANRGAHLQATAVRTSAIAIARQIDDRHGLATVLGRAYWAHGTTLEEVLAMLAEAVELADELGDVELRAEAMEWRLPALIGLGDLAGARRELEEVLELGSTMGQPFILHVAEHYASAIALCEGRLEEAERRAERSHEWSRSLITGQDPTGVYGVQMFSVRREQGRLAELAPVVRVLAGDADPGSAWGPGLAALLAELGMVDETQRTLARILADGLDPLRESLWLASVTYLTDAAAAVGDRETAALVYPELEPLAGRNVMIGYGVACYGAADRYLGMLSATLGEWDRAEEHLEAAAELNRRMGARTWLAHTAYQHGRMLLARGRPEDRARAESLLTTAVALAEEIGMAALAARAGALGSPQPTQVALPDGLSPREIEILRLVARGLSNREIGAALTISEHTAANHVRSILRKTGSANRTEAASYAYRRGLAER
jgi:DNA-binding CsgD family transcriptional regulator/tetratricopeptide (TPR) repeat protein